MEALCEVQMSFHENVQAGPKMLKNHLKLNYLIYLSESGDMLPDTSAMTVLSEWVCFLLWKQCASLELILLLSGWDSSFGIWWP